MKVNWLKVCAIGLKVLLAVGTGIAVFAGVNHVTNNSSSGEEVASKGSNFKEPNIASTVTKTTTSDVTKSVNVVDGLRATQSSLERIISVVGSLATAAESIGMIFSRNNTPVNNSYGNQAWFTGGGNYWQPNYSRGYNFYGNRQINPFIQEVG